MPLEPKPPVTGPAGPPSWMAPVVPVVPDHELLRRIGGGSYGDVWLARTTVGTWRAVKVVFRDRFTDARPYEREFNGMLKFEPLSRGNEAFVDILQIGRNDAEGYFYYVMELADDAAELQVESSELSVEGEAKSPQKLSTSNFQPSTYVPKTLSKVLLQRGRLPLGECLELGLTLNLGLAHLHRAGLIHRDIKPSNLIFVGGVPKLADIGLVIETAEARSYVGTEGFIPPEGPNSPQADLFSLGKVLYEAGMGKDRKDFPEPFTQIIDAPNRTQLLEFNAVLLKACAANVKERYQSAEEMNADLALLQSGGSVRRQRKLAGQLRFVQRAGAVVTVIAALAAGLYLWQARQTRIVRNLAAEKTQLAEEKTRLATEKTSLANTNARLADEKREQLVRLRVANGVRLMEEGDLSGALLWFAEALPLVTNKPTEEAIHRIRIQQVLDASPRLLSVIAHKEFIASAFSPHSRHFVTATIDQHLVDDLGYNLVMWDPASREPSWRLALRNPVLWDFRFDREGRRLLFWSSTSHGLSYANVNLGHPEVIDVETGRSLLPTMKSNLVFSAFSPDDRWLAIANTNHHIELIDARTGRTCAEILEHTNLVTMLAFSFDSSLLASSSRDGTVRFWRVPGGEPVGEPLRHDQPVERLAWSADGRYIATAAGIDKEPQEWESSIQTWDAVTHQKIGPTIAEPGEARALFFTPIGPTLLLTGGDMYNVRVWKVGTDVTADRTLKFDTTRCWEFSPDGRMLALGADVGYVSIWSTESWELLYPPFHHSGRVGSVHFSADGTRLLTTSEDDTTKVWLLKQNGEAARLSLSANFTDSPAHLNRPRGQTPGPIPIVLKDKGVHLIDPDKLVEIGTLKARQTNAFINNWAADSSGRFWAVAEANKDKALTSQITLWTRENGTLRSTALPHPKPIVIVQFNADDSRLLTFGDDEILRVWRTVDGTIERSIPVPSPDPPSQKILRPDLLLHPFDRSGSNLLQLTKRDSNFSDLQLFDLVTQQLKGKPYPIDRVFSGVSRAQLSPDGSRLVAVGHSQKGKIIDLHKGELATPEFKHGQDIYDVEWSRDGKQVLTSGWGVKSWDASTGELIGAPMAGDISAHWSADGRFIATRDENKRVRVYDAATTELVTPPLQHLGYVRFVCVTPNNRLVTASDPNLLRAWDLKPTALPVAVIADYARFLSGRKLSAGGALLPLPAEEVVKLQRSLRTRAPQLFE